MAQLRSGNGEDQRAHGGATCDDGRALRRTIKSSVFSMAFLVAGGVLVSCRSSESPFPQGDVGEIGAAGGAGDNGAAGEIGAAGEDGAPGEVGSPAPADGNGGSASGDSAGKGESALGGAGGLGAMAGPTDTSGAAGAGGLPSDSEAAAGASGVGTGGVGDTTGPLGGAAGGAPMAQPPSIPSTVVGTDDSGTATTCHADDAPDGAALFTRALGTNGRSCASCHAPEQSMSFSAAAASARFDASQGTDPLFRPIDGAVSPTADVSTPDARRAAYALLLSRGLIRVGLPVPANADFDVTSIKDPYGHASVSELSLFRRPLPAANLRFTTAVMWDGREGLVSPADPTNGLLRALASQATHAVLGHAQGDAQLSAAAADSIVGFELGIYAAQTSSSTAGPLDALFAFGGTQALIGQEFFPGINASSPSLGTNPTGLPFNPIVFTTFAAWEAIDGSGAQADAQRLVAEGERIFNLRTFSITTVPGLTTDAQPSVTGTCSFCHNSPQVGSTSTSSFFNLGLSSDTSKAAANLPLYTLKERSSGTEMVVSDPGRALITGAFKDVGAFKVPALRGLAARAPYFHNGGVATLSGVVGFYNGRFNIGLSDHEKTALTAFLASL